MEQNPQPTRKAIWKSQGVGGAEHQMSLQGLKGEEPMLFSDRPLDRADIDLSGLLRRKGVDVEALRTELLLAESDGNVKMEEKTSSVVQGVPLAPSAPPLVKQGLSAAGDSLQQAAATEGSRELLAYLHSSSGLLGLLRRTDC